MDGVGGSTRMGSRSSTRHGGPQSASIFHGPVRKWRKSWSPINTTTSAHASSRVLLYKWSPISGNKDDVDPAEEQAAPAVRFVPVSVIMAKQTEEKQPDAGPVDIEEDDKEDS